MRIATYRTLQRIEIGVLSQDGSCITPFDLPPGRAEKGLLAVLEADQAILPLRSVDHPHRIGSVEVLAPIPRPRRNIICIVERTLKWLNSNVALNPNDKGKSWTLKKGDAFIIPAGFKGTWETVKKVRKHYVILLPKT